MIVVLALAAPAASALPPWTSAAHAALRERARSGVHRSGSCTGWAGPPASASSCSRRSRASTLAIAALGVFAVCTAISMALSRRASASPCRQAAARRSVRPRRAGARDAESPLRRLVRTRRAGRRALRPIVGLVPTSRPTAPGRPRSTSTSSRASRASASLLRRGCTTGSTGWRAARRRTDEARWSSARTEASRRTSSRPTSTSARACTSTAAAPGSATASVVFCSSFDDSRLYRIEEPGAEPVPITPEPPRAERAPLCGRPRLRGRAPDRLRPRDARSRRAEERARRRCRPTARRSRASSRPAATSTPRRAPSPDGKCLAWLAWDHPHMPFEGTGPVRRRPRRRRDTLERASRGGLRRGVDLPAGVGPGRASCTSSPIARAGGTSTSSATARCTR